MSAVLDFVWLAGQYAIDFIVGLVKERPGEAVIFAIVLMRMFGTTVQTGWKGVLFRFGRATQELEPGFHGLIPFVHKVRKTPVRSITLHLPKQRITTADGLVYDVQANLIYRIADATRALIEIDNVRQGCETLLPIIIHDLMRAQTRQQLRERKPLDDELTVRAGAELERWGVVVEQAGFMTIAPTAKTLRLTQLGLLAQEREQIMNRYRQAGLSPELSAMLLGTERIPISHAAARYRARSGQVGALRKSLLKAFLVIERHQFVQQLISTGHTPQDAEQQAATAESELREKAEEQARRASLEMAARRKRLSLPPPPPTEIVA